VTDELVEHYRLRAANPHVAMITTEHSFFMREGMKCLRMLGIDSDDKIPGLRRITEAIHESGKIAICQLNHCGAAADPAAIGLPAAKAPSAVLLPEAVRQGRTVVPDEMTVGEIREVEAKMTEAAIRAKEAGYDGVEIHCAHAYLLNQFYSPLTNLRVDEYGGPLENRARILLETLDQVRAAVGKDYLISVRLGGCDYTEGGSTIEDAVQTAQWIEEHGADMISVTGGMCGYMRKNHLEPGYFSDMSKAIKKAVSMPVLLAGGVKTLEQAEELLEQGSCDMIGVARKLFANPDWEA
jgi:2,4-dienoyl-CoA reductase-like NADH-dependent reductase (Old Yellow Enzyme family)